MTDELGQRGESLFSVIITRFYGRPKPVFRPQFLGDKRPVVDFFVELIGDSLNSRPYFFVQVKSTRLGYNTKNRLKIRVPATEMRNLASLPAPTYIVGIDDIQERGYIVSANGEYSGSISSLSTKHTLNRETQDMLWEEVKNFWGHFSKDNISSYFIDSDWRST
jgi:hypothetical protein